ncbi:MAG TPA: copper chaperone PCu(A)C [Vicinamibacterales bacterium]|nr:copper chaperone PCu(A)C [Vicinamibacterales bacterium]
MDGLGRSLIVLLVSVASIWAAHSDAVGAQQKLLAATEAWILAPRTGETMTTAFAIIDNPTMYDVYLVSASTDVAGRVQFRQKSKVAAMPETVSEVNAPAFGKAELTAEGVHLALIDLKRPLKDGETITISFAADNGSVITASATVRGK